MPTWITDILNSFFSSIDKVVYYLISQLVGIFNTVAHVSLFSNDILSKFYNRVYAFLAIIMIFKVSFSILQYIINPDDFTNGERGFGKVIQGIILSLIAIVSVPFVFKAAYGLQNRILDSNIIPTIILGVNANSSASDGSSVSVEQQEEAQNMIPFMLAQAFVVPNIKVKDITYDKGYKINNEPYISEVTGTISIKAAEAIDKKSNATHTILEEDAIDVTSSRLGQVVKYAFAHYDYAVLFDVVNDKNDVDGGDSDLYIFEYRPLISTAAGIFVIILYLNFLMDITIRIVKFGFLEMIAPIPVISMVDPKSTKSGLMSKWMKNCINTYLGLFIRIAAVNFVVYIVTIIMNDHELVKNNATAGGVWINIVILFGALMFARDIPKLISDLTGIDLNGSFNMNPLRRFEEKAVMGKHITGLAAGAAGGAIGMLTGAGLFRGLTGGVRGAMSGKGFAETWRNTKDQNAKYRTANLVDRNPFRRTWGRITTGINDAIGTGGHLAINERQEANVNRRISEIDDSIKHVEEQKNRIKGSQDYRDRQLHMEQQKGIADSISKYKERAIAQVEAGEGIAGQNYKRMLRLASEARANGDGERAARLEQNAVRYRDNHGWRFYASEVERGNFEDLTLTGHSNKVQDAYRAVYGHALAAGPHGMGETMHRTFGNARGEINRLEIEGANDERRLSALDREIAAYNEQKAPLNEDLRRISDERKRRESYKAQH